MNENDAHDLLLRMPSCFKPAAAGDLRMTVQYMVARPVYVRIDRGQCEAVAGVADAADVTLKVKDKYLIRMMSGRMYGITAFVTGRLKVEGNYVLAQKLQQVFEPKQLFR